MYNFILFPVSIVNYRYHIILIVYAFIIHLISVYLSMVSHFNIL